MGRKDAAFRLSSFTILFLIYIFFTSEKGWRKLVNWHGGDQFACACLFSSLENTNEHKVKEKERKLSITFISRQKKTGDINEKSNKNKTKDRKHDKKLKGKKKKGNEYKT